MLENAIRVGYGLGGSLNTVLHIPAIAKEAGININPEFFDKISREQHTHIKLLSVRRVLSEDLWNMQAAFQQY